MSARIFPFPTHISASGTGSPPVLQVHFELKEVGDVLIDKRVRLVVYDKSLYPKSRLGRGGLLDFTDETVLFDQPDLLSDNHSEQDPALGPGSGVLLSVEGVLHKTKVSQRWFMSITDIKENAKSLQGPITLHLVNEHGLFAPVGKIAYRDDDIFRIGGDLVLLIRMHLLEPAGGLQKGAVLISSLNPRHNPGVRGTPDDKPNRVDWDAVSSATPTVGGNGGFLPPPTARPTTRVLPQDLTGYYEAQVANYRTTDPVLLVHINQAGHQLVGWFTPPASFPGITPAVLPKGAPTKGGAFRTIESHGPSGPWEIEWWEGPSTARNEADPDDKVGTFRRGVLAIRPGHPQDDFLQELDLIFNLDDQGSDGLRVPLTRRGLNARWPFGIIRDVVRQDVREALVEEQLKPVPTTFWSRVDDVLSDRNLRLVADVRSWVEANAGPLFLTSRDRSRETVAREDVAKILSQVVGVLPHGDDVVILNKVRAIAAANNISVSVSGTPLLTLSVLEWMKVMVNQEMGDLRENFPGKSDQDLAEKLEPVFRRVGLEPSGRFIYTLDFTALGTSTPVLVVGVGGFAFRCGITKQIQDDPTGRAPPVNAPDSASFDGKRFSGIYAEVGAGLALNLKKITGKAPFKTTTGGAKPGKVELRSFHDLAVNDFDGMKFSISSLKIGEVSAAFFEATALNSVFLQFQLQNGVFLDAVAETTLHAGFTKVNFAKLLFKVGKTIVTEVPKSPQELGKAEFDAFLPSVTVIELTQGWGKCVFDPAFVTRPEPSNDPLPTSPARRQDVRRTRDVLFDVDSAEIPVYSRGDLERSIAIDRALFTTADGWIRCAGYASPEASTDHNQKLSEARAFAVAQAVKDALGDALRITQIEHLGRGELPSEAPVKDGGGGLLDPERAKPGDQARIQNEHATQWDRWRKVDLVCEGVLVATVRGRGAKED